MAILGSTYKPSRRQVGDPRLARRRSSRLFIWFLWFAWWVCGPVTKINQLYITPVSLVVFSPSVHRPDRPPQAFTYISVLGQTTHNPELITQNFPEWAE